MIATKLKRARMLGVVFVFLITSCGVVRSETPVTASSVAVQITPSVSPMPTTILAIPSLTYTPISATPTIPVSTLSAKEKEIVINQLLAEDYECMLPCWGGDEVYFYILDVLPIDTNNPYTVYLFYKDAGILAEYNGVSPKGETISVCFENGHGQKSRAAFLSLWSKGSDKTFSEVITQYMSKFSDYSSLKYYKLEELSTYTSSDLFEFYELEENENQCLRIKNPNPRPS